MRKPSKTTTPNAPDLCAAIEKILSEKKGETRTGVTAREYAKAKGLSDRHASRLIRDAVEAGKMVAFKERRANVFGELRLVAVFKCA